VGTLFGRQLPGAGLVSGLIRGEVASVTAALDVGAAAAALCGETPVKRVIPCPHPELEKLLPTLG
ncbi:MAG: BMC domain-containing protein, partial [Clostridiales bacterium]|nr:BMC domain-containing protein [Clostridiales bacterium]